jgi:hypothetical protein
MWNHPFDRLAIRIASRDGVHRVEPDPRGASCRDPAPRSGTPADGPGMSRRSLVKLGLSGFASAVFASLLRFPAPAWADCESDLFTCTHSFDAEGELGRIAYGNFGPGITDKFKSAALGFYVNLALTFAEVAYREYQHRSGCYSAWQQCVRSTGGQLGTTGGNTGGQPSTPVGSAYPPGQEPAGCGCAPGDACCNCGLSLPTLCCIYGDCRCCP